MATSQCALEYFAAGSEPVADRQPFKVPLVRSGRTAEVLADRCLLDILEEAEVYVPFSCESGVCGSCACRVLDGEVYHRDHVLKAGECKRYMTACVMQAKSEKSDTGHLGETEYKKDKSPFLEPVNR